MSKELLETGSGAAHVAPTVSCTQVARAAVVHQNVGAAIYAVIPPRRVPLHKRLFWHLVLQLLRSPRGRAWIAGRYGLPQGD